MMPIRLWLDTPTPADLLAVLEWRKTCPETLRTPRDLTPPEQDAFYRDVICNRASPHRYYAVRQQDWPGLVALVSLENISWENGHAEIGLIVSPECRGKGIGAAAVDLVLAEAFGRLRLLTVWGEVYHCGHRAFWARIVERYHGSSVVWPRRKWWAGALHDADLFTITATGYLQAAGHD